MLLRLVRWAGRITSALVIIFFLLSLTEPAGSASRTELIALFFFPGLVGIGLLAAWWREGLGVSLATIGLVAFYLWSALSGGHFARGPWFFVCWSPTLLFAAAWWLRRRPPTSGAAAA